MAAEADMLGASRPLRLGTRWRRRSRENEKPGCDMLSSLTKSLSLYSLAMLVAVLAVQAVLGAAVRFDAAPALMTLLELREGRWCSRRGRPSPSFVDARLL